MRAVISNCLLGERCRYDGGAKACPAVVCLAGKLEATGVCPECEGGLPVPRPAAEILGDRVVTRAGADVTEAYRRGAQACLARARTAGAPLAVLKD